MNGKRDETVFISDSIIPESARLYFRAEVKGSEIKEMCIVGDNSRVRESLLGEYVSIDRNNLVMGSCRTLHIYGTFRYDI